MVCVRTIVGEDVAQHELLGEPQAAAGRRVVGVRDAASPERGCELCFSADDLRPQPREFLSRRCLVVVRVGLSLDVVAATQKKIIEQEVIAMLLRLFCCCCSRTRKCSTTTRSNSRNGLYALHEKRHCRFVIEAGCVS